MVARTRRTNSAACSTHAGEPSVRAPDDRASASNLSVPLQICFLLQGYPCLRTLGDARESH
ncbi:hypothetical protein AXF42_Ash001986 [Apostasia shenzhenica]|uniref:Uncharacterized protein n=1 Tax=Apostasia shenzhenica TaxID=1088818 RepID=A0A2I0ABW2_9ASPA|nr:hypothetical protein AXF42_Ash001986 [Apostasia shenzhenica]